MALVVSATLWRDANRTLLKHIMMITTLITMMTEMSVDNINELTFLIGMGG